MAEELMHEADRAAPGRMTQGADHDILVALEKVRVIRDGRAILQDVSLEVRRGEIVTIVGPNGAGKSTLVKVVIGAIEPDGGRVWRRSGLRIGYVPQKLMLDPTMPLTAGRFITLASGASADAIAAMLERVGVPYALERQMTALSGGEMQRVLLAAALLHHPDLLVLDEPAQGLDQPGEAAFYRLLETCRREEGMAILMVSHDLHVVMSASDRVICLNHHVCCTGTPAAVEAAPEYRALFGAGTQGALALYRHTHDHEHDPAGDCLPVGAEGEEEASMSGEKSGPGREGGS